MDPIFFWKDELSTKSVSGTLLSTGNCFAFVSMEFEERFV